jgi:hypothetical protein
MKCFIGSKSTRPAGWMRRLAMAALLVNTIAFAAVLHSQPAAASPSSDTLTVIVAPFIHLDKQRAGGDDLARWAADAIAVELANSGRFEVLKAGEVNRQAKELGFRSPYDKDELNQIAVRLGASAVVSGDVAFVRARSSKSLLRAVEVGLRVRITDTSQGEFINGSAQIGIAKVKPEETEFYVLAKNAVSKAALLGAREIISYTLPEGIVTLTQTNLSGTQVLINRGARDGVREGLEMLVLRNGLRVGHVRVTGVFATDAEAILLDTTEGIRPMDKIRVVFPMPEIESIH